ncbi:hypothetical protein CI102_9604 [Trichoderma harzianum]|nr:hypothetical protein CI102_9604 [Trichoderma harzianum]
MAVISKLLPVAAALLGSVNHTAAMAVRSSADRWDVSYRVQIGTRLAPVSGLASNVTATHVHKREEDHGPDCDCELHVVYVTPDSDQGRYQGGEGSSDPSGKWENAENRNGEHREEGKHWENGDNRKNGE